MRTIRAEPVTIAPVSQLDVFTVTSRGEAIVHRWPSVADSSGPGHLLLDPFSCGHHWDIVKSAIKDGRFVDHLARSSKTH